MLPFCCVPSDLAAVADAVRTSLGPRGMDKMVGYSRVHYSSTGSTLVQWSEGWVVKLARERGRASDSVWINCFIAVFRWKLAVFLLVLRQQNEQ